MNYMNKTMATSMMIGQQTTKMEDYRDFSVWVAQEIERRGLSYRALAASAGVSKSSILTIVKAANAPNLGICIRVAKALGREIIIK